MAGLFTGVEKQLFGMLKIERSLESSYTISFLVHVFHRTARKTDQPEEQQDPMEKPTGLAWLTHNLIGLFWDEGSGGSWNTQCSGHTWCIQVQNR